MRKEVDFLPLVDPAHREQLKRYDRDRIWILVKPECPYSLPKVAELVEESRATGDPSALRELMRRGYIQIEKTIDKIEGEWFYCVYFPEFYVLERVVRRV